MKTAGSFPSTTLSQFSQIHSFFIFILTAFLPTCGPALASDYATNTNNSNNSSSSAVPQNSSSGKPAVASWQPSTFPAPDAAAAAASYPVPATFLRTKKEPGPFRRLLKSAADEVGGTAAALIGATIGDADIDLPPDSEDNPSWPLSAPRRSAMYTVYWTNGSTAKISRTPEGSYCVTGGGHCMTLQKEPGGVFALLGEDGSMGTLTPRLDGGYTLIKSDGTSSMLLPRQGGGFNVVSERGTVATIIPGPGGSRHVFAGGL